MMRIYGRWYRSPVLTGVGLLLACGVAFGQVNLYVPNGVNAPPNLSEFTINTSTGALTPVVGQPSTNTNADNPIRVAMTPNNQFLYVSTGGNIIDAFSVGPGGFLTPLSPTYQYALAGSPYGITATNNFLYVTTQNNNLVNVFSIGANGALTGPLTCAACGTGAGSSPQSIVVDPTGNWVYVALNGTNQIGVGTIVQSGGTAGTLSSFTTPYTGPGTFTPLDLTLNPNGNALFASNYTGAAAVTAFTVSGAAVTFVNNYTTGGLPIGVAVDPAGKYLYVANFATANVSEFSIGAGAVLTSLGTIGAGTRPFGASVDPTGHFLYVSNSGSATVSSYSLGATGALTFVNTQATGTGPQYLLAHLVPASPTVPAASPWSLAAMGILLAGISGLLYRKAYR